MPTKRKTPARTNKPAAAKKPGKPAQPRASSARVSTPAVKPIKAAAVEESAFAMRQRRFEADLAELKKDFRAFGKVQNKITAFIALLTTKKESEKMEERVVKKADAKSESETAKLRAEMHKQYIGILLSMFGLTLAIFGLTLALAYRVIPFG